ncbi:MAG: dipeptidase [Chitinophagaceae bacterium]|nr:dipeptidase [Chitinophagaceae bacterium]
MIPIIDLHCHPAIKVYMFNKDIRHIHHPWSDVYPFGMHVDLPGMKESNVRVILCSHYIPEAGFTRLHKSEWLFKILRWVLHGIMKRWESYNNPDDAYSKVLQSIDKINHQVAAGSEQFNVVNVTNIAEFKIAWKLGKTIVLHTLEGSHQLGSHSNYLEHYTTHLKILKNKGVCSITLAHFFENSVCDTGGGIPPSTAHKIGYPENACTEKGLTSIGADVVHWCQDNGMIIDLVHSSVTTRTQVYEILEKRQNEGKIVRPVSFTHTGIRELAGPNMKIDCDRYYLPDLDEIEKISKYKGVVGLILMNYWLIGIEEDDPGKIDNAIPYILQSIDLIYKRLLHYDSIAIGTDLDGFTQVPDDLGHIRLLSKISSAIQEKLGTEIAEKICYKNALGLLQHAWD